MDNRAESIFSLKYWKVAASEFRNLRSLIFAGLTIALASVLSALYFPVGVNLRVTATFLALAVGSMIFGPIVGLSAGLCYDLVGYFLMPSTIFFPGYTLSSMLAFLVYGLFLYRRQISVLGICLCKLTVNFVIHVGLGSLWSAILFDKGYYYFFIKSLVKNTILFPFEVAALVALLQLLIPILVREGIIPKQNRKCIPFLNHFN